MGSNFALRCQPFKQIKVFLGFTAEYFNTASQVEMMEGFQRNGVKVNNTI